MSRPPAPEAVVFDIGNVLIEWDPRRLYRKLLPDEEAVEWFLSTVCTPEWNAGLDRGRPYAEAIASLTERHPDQAALIAAYRERWAEMLGDDITGTVSILDELRAASVPCYGLTNFSTETWPLACRRFPFLVERLEAIMVSGQEGIAKPSEGIYHRLAARFGLRPRATVFVDDLPANVHAAQATGFQAVRFESAGQLRLDLRDVGLPV